MTDYEKGFMTEVAELAAMYGNFPEEALALRSRGLDDCDCSELHDRHKQILKMLNTQEDLNLKGLD